MARRRETKPKDEKQDGRELTVVTRTNQLMTIMEPEYRKVLPAHITPAQLGRVATTAMNGSKDLAKCDPTNIAVEVMKGAQLGLMPDGKEGALVPRRIKDRGWVCQFQPMFQGAIKLAYQSGIVSVIDADVVYKQDHWEFWRQDGETHYRHEPADGPRPDKDIVLAYATCKLKDGTWVIARVARDQLDKRNAVSKAKADSAPWQKWFPEMCKKTAVWQLEKYMPKSSDLLQFRLAADVDRNAEAGIRTKIERDQVVIEVPAAKVKQEPEAKQSGLDGFAGDGKPPDTDPNTGEEIPPSGADNDQGPNPGDEF